MSDQSNWYRDQYNALQRAQYTPDKAASDAKYFEAVRQRSNEVRQNALQTIAEKEAFIRERNADFAQSSAADMQRIAENTARMRQEISNKYSQVSIPDGKGNFLTYQREFPTFNGGGETPKTSGAINTPKAVPVSTAPQSQVSSSGSNVIEFTGADSTLKQRPATASAPPLAQPSLAQQLGGSLAAIPVTLGADFLGDRASEAVWGSSNGIGSQIGSMVGGLVGGVLGAGLAGVPTLGIGATTGGLIGLGFGTSLGSFIGGGLDSLAGLIFPSSKASPVADKGKGYINPQNITNAPFIGGQQTGVTFYLAFTRSEGDQPSQSILVAQNGVIAVGATIQEALTQHQTNGSAGFIAPITGVISDTTINPQALVPSRVFVLGTGGGNVTVSLPDNSGFIFGGESYQKFIYNFNGALRTDGQPEINPNAFAPNATTPFEPNNPAPKGAVFDPTSPFDALATGERYTDGTGRKEPRAIPDETKPSPLQPRQINPTGTPSAPPTPVSPLLGSSPAFSGDKPTAKPESSSNASETLSTSKPSFTAKPFISGVSDPSEAYDPVDINTGLTRSQQEQQWQEQQKQIQDNSQANQRASAAFDAKEMAKQLAGLSTVKRADLGGLSPQEFQRNELLRVYKDDPVRSAALNNEFAKLPIPSPTATPTPKPNTPNQPSTDNYDTAKILGGLAAIAGTVTALKIGSDLLVNNSLNNTPKINEIANNTTPTAQQTNAKQGVCDAMQPQQCGYEGVKQATTEATNPIKDIANDNKGALAGLLNLLATIWDFLQDKIGLVLSKVDKIKDFLDLNAKVESVKSTITLALTLHNALMLSQSLGDTLGVIIDNVLNVFGNTFRTTEGAQISASQFLGATVKNWIISAIGVENYTKLSDTFAQANRIYQTGMNILSTTQGMFDAAASAAQATGIKLSLLMNGLRDESVVSPKAYGQQDESALGNRALLLDRFTQLTTTISDADSKAQNLVTITSAPIQIKDSIKQSKDDIKAFNNARDANSAESQALRDAKLEEIKALRPITEATITRRDEDS